MGLSIERSTFAEDEYAAFRVRLRACLEALALLLARPGFGRGPTTVGAELEVFLVDASGCPLALNTVVQAESAHPNLTLELGRFNLEYNASPVLLAGRPFKALGDETRAALRAVREAVGRHHGDVALIGTLPTLTLSDFSRDAITESPRYQALDFGLRRLREEPFRVRIAGDEALAIDCDDVSLEAANTAWQVHLRVAPERFAAAYNAAQLTTAPVLAAAGNSPLMLGRRLWAESRIAMFEQAVDERTAANSRRAARVAFGRGWLHTGPLELFAESVELFEPLLPLLDDEDPLVVARGGGLPQLAELRLHQGTVWRWNRAIYDAGHGGHLRLELRALPAGPTVVDMLANAAFHLGLVYAFAPTDAAWTRTVPFPAAHRNFYAAARHGLECELDWPTSPDAALERIPAAELALRLVPLALDALVEAGVDGEEAAALLKVVTARAASGQTGATWQRRALDVLEPGFGREAVLLELLRRYQEHARAGAPVHTWPLPQPSRVAPSGMGAAPAPHRDHVGS